MPEKLIDQLNKKLKDDFEDWWKYQDTIKKTQIGEGSAWLAWSSAADKYSSTGRLVNLIMTEQVRDYQFLYIPYDEELESYYLGVFSTREAAEDALHEHCRRLAIDEGWKEEGWAWHLVEICGILKIKDRTEYE